MIAIADPASPQDFDAVRRLCWDYRAFLLTLGPDDKRAVLAAYPQEKYTALMDRIATEHAPPAGGIKLARHQGKAIGCGMFHTVLPGTAEIKRVYVAPAARSLGAGRALMLALIDQCRAQGFQRIVMDTGQPLQAAARLYDDLGFRRRGPYTDMPAEIAARMLFFEMAL
ncbi:GNAT family N-acetyltransferase [Thalassococcus sp. CAU 1522]|uniref:GNAT family N-acetyltransferase n=1 Tax=Thalassococcus arenae TaxID=2851652 RepID=A0ABS6N2K1_9RHOB|nr:GNAT family N-acetyltransferase [Thalassococcus arenae]MBV2358236.1 GNAT family N-acetyltransferase [Thalassococcus arenae]